MAMFGSMLGSQLEASHQAPGKVLAAIRGSGTIQEKFTRVMDAIAPPVPNIDGLPALRKKANEILAPALLNKYLPPLPRALAKSPITQAVSPKEPSDGPPLPSGLDISWPSFLQRAIARLKAEPPWVTIPKRGIREELRREIQVVTGVKLGGKA